MLHHARPLVAFTLAIVILSSSCQTTSPPLLGSAESVQPVLAGKQDILLFECAFFTAPDGFELLKNTRKNHVAGVFSPEDGDRLLVELKRNRKFELMSSPSVSASQGQSAKVEVIREFIYPIEFDPPVIGEAKPDAASTFDSFPVTPTRPRKFATKNVGITAEFKGRSTSDGGIDCEFDISQVNFLGFVNYGSPISTTGETALGNPVQIVLTENKIEQPVFGAKRLSSTITFPNGHYLAVGGMRNDLQKSLDAQTRSAPVENDKNLFALIKVTAVKP